MTRQTALYALGFCLLIALGALGVNAMASVSRVEDRSPTARPVVADALVVRNGTVIDGTGRAPIRDGVVVIAKDKIAAVGSAANFIIPPDARVIDAQGGTILPGIINSNVHEVSSPLVRQFYYLRHGVTTVCDLGTALDAMRNFQDSSGYGLTARGFRSGPVINVLKGYPGSGEYLFEVEDAEQARQAVAYLVSRGADMVKVALESGSSKLPWPAPAGEPIPNFELADLRALVAEAHARGMLVLVHLGTAEVLDLALDAGIDVFEHVPLPRLGEIDFQTGSENGNFAKLSPAYEAQLDRMVKQKVMMVPTLDKIITWCESFAATSEHKARCAKQALTPVHRFHEMGGLIALGDDSGAKPRTGMPIYEMRRLLDAGLTPTEIIQAGTARAAYACGHGDELGTLQPGKLADVIVVNGDPLNNIEAMNQVNHVIIGGQVFR
ncbi:MAG: amidohydrolase family protein [Chloroflexi bacterium]|nr:amidohydrolase family protein [Chloroflexota bacterium]